MQDRAAVFFLELNMLFGDMFDAFVEKRPSWNFSPHFMTASASEQHYEWWMHTKRNLLKQKHLEGKLQVAGYNVLPEQIPGDVLEKAPEPPRLSKMVLGGPESNKHICCPETVVKEWYHHPVYGVRFRAFMDKFHEEPSRISIWSDRPCDVIS